jgi:tripartite ATP-independent transporter DctM subunit
MASGQIALFMIPAMILVMFFGVPFFGAMGGVALFFGLAMFGPNVLFTTAIRVYSFLTEPSFVAVPMFVLMGTILGGTGIAELLFDGIYRLFGAIRGGLCVAVLLICILLAACTGVAAGPVATMGLIALPVMLKRRYNHGLACGSISAGGTLGTIIPPSIILIFYGLFANVSIGKLYFAAFIPGVMLGFIYISYILIIAALKPNMAPAAPLEERGGNLNEQLMMLVKGVIPVLFLIFAVLGTIFLGIATATEAAGVGAFGAVLISIAYRRFTLKGFATALTGCFRTMAMIAGMLLGSLFFVSVFLMSGAGATIANFVNDMKLGPTATIWAVMLIVFILGFVLDINSIIFITVPIFGPMLKIFGINELWFAILFSINCQIAYLTPPMAPGVYLLKPLCPPEVTLAEMYIGIIPFVLCDIVGMLLVYFIPPLATWLPSKMLR